MSKIIYSDYTDTSGKNYETIGENIRHAEESTSAAGIISAVQSEPEVANELAISANDLHNAILNLFSGAGNTVSFANTESESLSDDELQMIKTNLGIS